METERVVHRQKGRQSDRGGDRNEESGGRNGEKRHRDTQAETEGEIQRQGDMEIEEHRKRPRKTEERVNVTHARVCMCMYV